MYFSFKPVNLLLLKEGMAVAAALAVSVAAGIRVALLSESPRGKIIKISVDESGLKPDRLTLKRGEPVVLEIAAIAMPFVFFAPDLSGHLTLAPEIPTQLQLKPEKTGSFEFCCVACCDSGHPKLTGTVFVVD